MSAFITLALSSHSTLATGRTSGLLFLVTLILGVLLRRKHGIGWGLALHHAGKDSVVMELLQVVSVPYHRHSRIGIGTGTNGRIEWANALANVSVV